MRSTRIGAVALCLAAVAAVPASAPVHGAARWGWPVDPPHTVMRAFQRPPANWKAGHRGVDLAGAPGSPVRAAGDGTVVFAGLVAAKGVVAIEHGTGPAALRTTYEPLLPLVRKGQAVRKGDIIGTLAPGWSHCAPLGRPICLHWGLRRGSTYLDPMSLLARHARLLPLGRT